MSSQAAGESRLEPGRDPRHILIVDDEVDLCDILKTLFAESGYQVDVAYNGVQALEHVRAQRPDLILLDVMLPGQVGFNVARMIKFDCRSENIPIIMMTARHFDKDMDIAREVGAVGRIIKPFDFPALLDLVNSILN